MGRYFLVENAVGPEWDYSRGRREQVGWDAHAAFMDALVDEGFILLGGPTGEGESDNTVVIVEAADEAEVRQRFAPDPWADTILVIDQIRPWKVWLSREPDLVRR
jgi:uncharacterized protein YciI